MSRKNKAYRAFLHQNPSPTIEHAWDAAWANRQACFQSKRMQEQDDKITQLQAENATQSERIKALEAVINDLRSACEQKQEIIDSDGPREQVAQWMMAVEFATGHGDTLGDLLSEAGVQVRELRERIKALEAVAVHALFYLEGLPDADGYELGEALQAAGYGGGE